MMDTTEKDPLLLTRPAAARKIGFSRDKFDREVAPRLTPRVIGKRTYYHLDDLREVSKTLGVTQAA